MLPDPKFRSVELARFINKVMIGGKKTVAQRVVYDALDMAERQGNRPGIEHIPSGPGERDARAGGPLPKSRRGDVPGPQRRAPGETRSLEHALDRTDGPRPERSTHVGAAGK